MLPPNSARGHATTNGLPDTCGHVIKNEELWCEKFSDPVNPCRKRVGISRDKNHKCSKCKAKGDQAKNPKKGPDGGREGKSEKKGKKDKSPTMKNKDKPAPKKSILKKTSDQNNDTRTAD